MSPLLSRPSALPRERQKRTFEIAVRRLLGSSRALLASLLGVQVSLYAIPAWAAGLIIAQIVARMVLRSFAKSSGLPVHTTLTPSAVLYATGLAFGSAVVAAIGPIRTALTSTLRDALDYERPKTSAVKFTITRAQDNKISWCVPLIAVWGCGNRDDDVGLLPRAHAH